MTERDTLEAAHNGMSLARYGDGELKLALGRDAKSQRHHPELEKKLRWILAAPASMCLPCIPNIGTDDTPKLPFWRQYRDRRYVRLYHGLGPYGSAFITRPDSAPWIDVDSYWARLVDLWRERDVVLVRGSSKSLCKSDLVAAGNVDEIIPSRQHAWADHDDLFARLKTEKRRVLLCLGATATVLAFELAREGVHAIDLGHVGMFLRKEGRFDRESFPS